MASSDPFPLPDPAFDSSLELDSNPDSDDASSSTAALPEAPKRGPETGTESEPKPRLVANADRQKTSSTKVNTAIGTPKSVAGGSSTPTLSQTPKDIPESEEERAASPEARKVHEGWMREALEMARLALRTEETPVGCVFVYNNQIVGRGMNDTNHSMNGTRHAEFMALNEMLASTFAPGDSGSKTGSRAGSDIPQTGGEGSAQSAETQVPIQITPSLLKECILYVTIEPCVMCASLLRQFGIKKVYFGARNDKFGGTGGVLKIHRWDEGLTPITDQAAEAGSRPEEDQEKGNRSRQAKGDKGGEYVGERRGRDGLTGYEVSGGWLAGEAIELLRQYYVTGNEKAPKPHRRKKAIEEEDKTVEEGE